MYLYTPLCVLFLGRERCVAGNNEALTSLAISSETVSNKLHGNMTEEVSKHCNTDVRDVKRSAKQT